MTIQPLPLARVSNLLTSQTTQAQLTTTQLQLLEVESQISTGKEFSEPSQDPGAASITMQLQRTLTQSQTYLSNITSAQSQLGVVDNSLSGLTGLVQQAQNIASADVNSDVTDSQRKADAQIIDSISTEALSIGNQQYNGLYLFAGDNNVNPPFVTSNGGVQFVGSTNLLQNSVDTTTDIPFMVNGADIFGGTTSQVQGTADLTPNLTATTRLSDLRGATGVGVQPGVIQISNGATTKLVDLSQASDIGDVVNAINAAGIGGITASITGQGITLSGAAGDNITVNEVSGGTTAAELGIRTTTGGGAGAPIVGASVEANVTALTPLSSLKGGAGIDLSGLKITNGTKTATISLAGATTVGDLVNAVNASGIGVTAQIDPSGTGIDIINPTQGLEMTVSENGGTTAADLGVQSFSAQTPLTELNNGKGVSFNTGGPDLAITTSNGGTFNVTLAGSTTVQDVINKINLASAGSVTASFSASANGIVLNDTTGGAGAFSVTPVTGSSAAGDLGLTQNPAVGATITGADVNPITSNGLFANLSNLSAALKSGNASQITSAAEGLQNDYQRIVTARGLAGAQVQQMQTRQDQITTQNTATQSLMSQLSDTDFTAAITKFQTLQTSLQATLEASARTLNISLLDFLG